MDLDLGDGLALEQALGRLLGQSLFLYKVPFHLQVPQVVLGTLVHVHRDVDVALVWAEVDLGFVYLYVDVAFLQVDLLDDLYVGVQSGPREVAAAGQEWGNAASLCRQELLEIGRASCRERV